MILSILLTLQTATGLSNGNPAAVIAALNKPKDQISASLDQLVGLARKAKDNNLLAHALVEEAAWLVDNKPGDARPPRLAGEAQQLFHKLGDRLNEAESYFVIGGYYYKSHKQILAVPPLKAAFPLLLAEGRNYDAGVCEETIGEILKPIDALQSIDWYLKALQAYKADVQNPAIKAENLARVEKALGLAYANQKNFDKALEYDNLAIADYSNNPVEVANVTVNRGWAYHRNRQFDHAIKEFKDARAIYYTQSNHIGEAQTLENMALSFDEMGKKKEAIAYNIAGLNTLEQAAPKGKPELTIVLRMGELYNNIASVQDDMGNWGEAFQSYKKALTVYSGYPKEARINSARTTQNIGVLYQNLGDTRTAIANYIGSVKVLSEQTDKTEMAKVLVNLGEAYSQVGHQQQAVNTLLHAKSLSETARDPLVNAHANADLGSIYFSKGDRDQGRKLVVDAYNILKPSFPVEAADAQRILASFDLAEGLHSSSLLRSEDSLKTYVNYGLLDKQAETFEQVGAILEAQGKVGAAEAFYKFSIEAHNKIIENIRNLPIQQRSIYKNSTDSASTRLAALLIKQKKTLESISALDSSRLAEDISPGMAPQKHTVDLTKEEKSFSVRYDQLSNSIITTKQQLDELNTVIRNSGKQTPEQTKRQAQLMADLAAYSANLDKWLDDAKNAFVKNDASPEDIDSINSSFKDLEAGLGKMPTPTAAVYTILSDDGIRLILVFSDYVELKVSDSKLIPKTDILNLVASLKSGLSDPGLDPTGPASRLFDILVRPLLEDLNKRGIKNLAWYLSGPLRYLPIDALYDNQSKTYAVEQFRSFLLVPQRRTQLNQPIQPISTVIGFGVTKQEDIGQWTFPALDGVNIELGALSSACHQAKIKKDGDFNLTQLQSWLGGGPSIVHLGTHCMLCPGNADGSFLVLGDGTALTAKDFSAKQTGGSLSKIDLLVLSACDTGTPLGQSSDGSELGSFATIALDAGVGTVIGTLWPVQDDSTATLMTKFYEFRYAGQGNLEALHNAQLWMLSANSKDSTAISKGANASTPRSIIQDQPAGTSLPKFKVNPGKPRAHPYYWAPFVLYGSAN